MIQRLCSLLLLFSSTLCLLVVADSVNTSGEDRDNCSNIHDPPDAYNDSCSFVKEECDDKHELFNYLQLVECGFSQVKPIGYVFLVLWLLYLLSLLSTTVDNFFVPVLHMLAEKLHLPPSIAGMTLLALGNGAPDIFVAFSALQGDDVALLLGALMGAGMFITTTVLGTVLLVTKGRNYKIDGIDFMRDVIAYIVVLAVIVAVAYDGTVYLFEAVSFPVVYIAYVAVVIVISFTRKWIKRRKLKKNLTTDEIRFNKENDIVHLHSKAPPIPSVKDTLEEKYPGDDGPTLRDEIERAIKETDSDQEINKKNQVVLIGLTLPRGFFKRVHFFLEWPFSLLRWLTIPPCFADEQWSMFHFGFAVFSPIPMALLLLIVVKDGWSGFTDSVGKSSFPLPVLLVICSSQSTMNDPMEGHTLIFIIAALPICILLFFLLSRKRPPNAVMQAVLMIMAFVMSIAWLNIIANEVVSVLQALGLLASISTAILGLTVLAIGNSVADWVADTIVAKKGKPEMAFASCFGAPLITHVMGLSFAFLGKMISDNGKAYKFDIRDPEYIHVKMSWIFLAISLLGSAVIFPLYRFKPPNEYGIVLMYVFIVFMVFSVLIETDILGITL